MVSSRSPPSSFSRPCCGRSKPATRRSRDDLPEPLGPVTSSASPAQTVKPTPLKTCRPPLTQVRSDPTSSIMGQPPRSEEHTSELQSRGHLVCRLLLEKKKNKTQD